MASSKIELRHEEGILVNPHQVKSFAAFVMKSVGLTAEPLRIDKPKHRLHAARLIIDSIARADQRRVYALAQPSASSDSEHVAGRQLSEDVVAKLIKRLASDHRTPQVPVVIHGVPEAIDPLALQSAFFQSQHAESGN